jgi:hypothetical protein
VLKQLLYFVAHIVLGVAVSNTAGLSWYYGIAIVLTAIIQIIVTQNRNNAAGKWAAYVVGMEVLLRMTGGMVVYEAGKYLVCLILLIGLFAERKVSHKPLPIITYGLLLLPSFIVVDFPDFLHFRKDVSFNLSGPLTLIIACIYFYKRHLNSDDFVGILKVMVLPLVGVLTYLALVTPELSEIEYGSQSNFQASAGFGPNQVSTMMGLGMMATGIALYYKRYVTGFLWADLILCFVFAIRGLATFSRGGMIGGVAALAILILLSFIFSKRAIFLPKVLMYAIGGVALAWLSWSYVNDLSDKRLQYRYQGINYRTGQVKEITSGRLLILEHELSLFYDNPIFGIGPGMIREIAVRDNFIANTHSEYSRTLAEHGMFGVIAILILVFFPINYILQQPKELYPVSFAILFLVFFTMFHSAMRLAMPGFLFGLMFFAPSNFPPK